MQTYRGVINKINKFCYQWFVYKGRTLVYSGVSVCETHAKSEAIKFTINKGQIFW